MRDLVFVTSTNEQDVSPKQNQQYTPGTKRAHPWKEQNHFSKKRLPPVGIESRTS